MPRYVIDIIYKGTEFFGTQRQADGARTVQEEVEKVLKVIFRQETKVNFAGRTDRGVHGLQMPIHFDIDQELDYRFLRSFNGLVPHDIAGSKVYLASDPDFSTRFHAIARSYQYNIVTMPNPIERDYALYLKGEIDVEAMQAAAKAMLEYKSYESFCKTGGGNKTFICDIKEASWEWERKDKLVFRITANRFLRGMVRATVGTMIWVGRGRLSLQDFRDIIEAKDRKLAGNNVSPAGLFLTEVKYPEGSFTEID